MTPTNRAAYLLSSKATPLEVKDAPYPLPRDDEIVVKTHAVAINPFDWILQEQGTSFMFTWLKYPFVLCTDVAGEVVQVGPRITRFKPGDRVLGQAIGSDKNRNSAAEGAFQQYVVLLANLTSHIPDTISYESASVIPLGLSTAACGLFQDDELGLHLPSTTPKPTGQTLLIWGGSTSVGCNAIQLAVSAGYEVFTTCSPKNAAYMNRLGASRVFDYNSQTVVQDLIKAFEGKPCAGALAVTIGSTDLCMDIVHACKAPGSRKFVAVASAPAPLPSPPSALGIVGMISSFAVAGTKTFVKAKRYGIGYKMIFGSTLAFNHVGKAINEDYLPKALEQEMFVCAPEPLVVEGLGLEYVQEEMEVQKKGVSARKVVVKLI